MSEAFDAALREYDAETERIRHRTPRASYLSPPDFHRLDWACRPVAGAFHAPVYLVGSVLRTADYRDIDLRLILPDDDPLFLADADTEFNPRRLLLNIALSDLISRSANAPAPIDFQIQSMAEANVPEHGARNPLGRRAENRI